jgi:predicted nucleic acid-binding protein
VIFLDTSVWVAGFADWHPYHNASRLLLAGAKGQNLACAAHSLAEVYATLTRLPGELRAHPRAAMQFLETIQRRATVISLDAREYVETIDCVSSRGMGGAVVYDALQLACARKADVERIYTWNLRHFRAIAPDLAQRIVAPGE